MAKEQLDSIEIKIELCRMLKTWMNIWENTEFSILL